MVGLGPGPLLDGETNDEENDAVFPDNGGFMKHSTLVLVAVVASTACYAKVMRTDMHASEPSPYPQVSADSVAVISSMDSLATHRLDCDSVATLHGAGNKGWQDVVAAVRRRAGELGANVVVFEGGMETSARITFGAGSGKNVKMLAMHCTRSD